MEKTAKRASVYLVCIGIVSLVNFVFGIVHNYYKLEYKLFFPYLYFSAFALPIALFMAGAFAADFAFMTRHILTGRRNRVYTKSGLKRVAQALCLITAAAAGAYRAVVAVLGFDILIGNIAKWGDMYSRSYVPIFIIFAMGVLFGIFQPRSVD